MAKKGTALRRCPWYDGYALNYPSSWVGMPQAPDAQCIAEQSAFISEGVAGPSTTEAGSTGKPLMFDLAPSLATLKLSGYCLWTQL